MQMTAGVTKSLRRLSRKRATSKKDKLVSVQAALTRDPDDSGTTPVKDEVKPSEKRWLKRPKLQEQAIVFDEKPPESTAEAVELADIEGQVELDSPALSVTPERRGVQRARTLRL